VYEYFRRGNLEGLIEKAGRLEKEVAVWYAA